MMTIGGGRAASVRGRLLAPGELARGGAWARRRGAGAGSAAAAAAAAVAALATLRPAGAFPSGVAPLGTLLLRAPTAAATARRRVLRARSFRAHAPALTRVRGTADIVDRAMAQPRRPVVIDTDTGVDDAIAMLIALRPCAPVQPVAVRVCMCVCVCVCVTDVCVCV